MKINRPRISWEAIVIGSLGIFLVSLQMIELWIEHGSIAGVFDHLFGEILKSPLECQVG